MLRTAFEGELQSLQDKIISLGSEVEENLILAVEILQQQDDVRAERLIKFDQVINERRISIGLDSLTLIATQQPIASDMRRIAAIIEIVGELERIHDYVKGIAKINIMLGREDDLSELMVTLPMMAEKARDMLEQSLVAFATRDATLAREIPKLDDEVDALYNQFYREIVDYVGENPDAVHKANLLEWAGHNLERSADRVTNICEWVVYMVDGVYSELDTEMEAPPAD
jgi:phosphate transport system protein